MAQVTSFTANPPEIKKGQSSTLSWVSDGCSNCYLLPIPGHPNGLSVDCTGSYEVTPEQSTVYLITCSACEEQASTVLVIVDGPIGS